MNRKDNTEQHIPLYYMSFEQKLAQHLASELDIDLSEVLTALDSYGSQVGVHIPKKQVPSKSTQNGQAARNTKNSKEPTASHFCERVKKGQSEPCGKPAKRFLNQLDGETRWFCGAEKSGCYSIVLTSRAKNDLDAPRGGTKAKPTLKSKPIENKATCLLNNINRVSSLNIVSYNSAAHGKLWYAPSNRILFDKETQEAYGKLNIEEDAIDDLDDNDIRFLEANNWKIRPYDDEVSEENESE